jgi:hypothetical protein
MCGEIYYKTSQTKDRLAHHFTSVTQLQFSSVTQLQFSFNPSCINYSTTMELQTLDVNEQYRYTLFAKDATKSSAVGVALKCGDGFVQNLSSSTAIKLFLVYPKLHRLFNKFSFQGLLTYRVDVDGDVCVTIELAKKYNQERKQYSRDWALNFTDLNSLQTTKWPFGWHMLPLFMSKSVELIKAVNHWEAELKTFHADVINQKTAGAESGYSTEDTTHEAINKEWVKVCACCESNEPTDIKLLKLDVASEAAEWRGRPYQGEGGDKKVEDAITLALERYGKEQYF